MTVPNSRARLRRPANLAVRYLVPRLALSLVALAAGSLILEVVLRLKIPDSPPGTTWGREVRLNRDGFRDREFTVPKPDNVYRILVLGDSFTWGVGLDVQHSVPKLIEKGLDGRLAGHSVEVVNAAEPGHNTVEQWHQLNRVGLRYAPDLVLLIYNLNDIEFLPRLAESNYAGPATPVVEVDPGEDRTRYSRNRGLRGLILAIERRSVLAQFVVPRVGDVLRRLDLIESVEFSWVEKIYQGFSDENPGWLESKRALAGIASLTRERGIVFAVAVYPLLIELESYQGQAAHRRVVGVCQGEGVAVVDLFPLFEGRRARSLWINFIDAHPSAEAHRLVADRLVEFLLAEVIAEQRERESTGSAPPVGGR